MTNVCNLHEDGNQRYYLTIEKECLSLILSLQHFEYYLTSSSATIFAFSDHNQLIFNIKWKKGESTATQMESFTAGIHPRV